MPRDERRAFRSALIAAFDAALPLQHSPPVVAVLCQFGKDSGEVDLSVTQRAESASAIDPRLEASVDALASGRIKFSVLDVKGFDTAMIDIDVV